MLSDTTPEGLEMLSRELEGGDLSVIQAEAASFLVSQAAEEIRRLRAEVHRLKEERKHLFCADEL